MHNNLNIPDNTQYCHVCCMYLDAPRYLGSTPEVCSESTHTAAIESSNSEDMGFILHHAVTPRKRKTYSRAGEMRIMDAQTGPKLIAQACPKE